MKISNSLKDMDRSKKWKDPGASLYNTIMKEDNWKELLKEAYLVAPVDGINESTSLNKSGCKYPHHLIKNGKLVPSLSGLRSAYICARNQGCFNPDVDKRPEYSGSLVKHINAHFRELGLKAEWHHGEFYLSEYAERKIESNFDQIYSCIMEHTGMCLFDKLDEFTERSHSKLKYSFRMGINVNNGHLVKIIFELNKENVDMVGSHDDTNPVDDNKQDDIINNINKTGYTDFISKEKVLAIVDMDTKEKLKSVVATGVMSGLQSYASKPLKERESMAKSEISRLHGGKSYVVGQIEGADETGHMSRFEQRSSGTYKSTRPANKLDDLSKFQKDPIKYGRGYHKESAGLTGPNDSELSSEIFKIVGNTPESISKWMRDNISYDKTINGWKLKTPAETFKLRTGNCHDQSLFESFLFHSLGIINGQLFFVEFSKDNPVGGNTHTLTWYRVDTTNEDYKYSYYWFENAWEDKAGIHGPYNCIDGLKHAVFEAYKNDRDINQCKYDGIVFSTLSNYRCGMSLGEYVESWRLEDDHLVNNNTPSIHESYKSIDSSEKYYRVTHDGIGIYEATRQQCSAETWKRLLKSDAFTWLPKPKEYPSECRSYFTKDGIGKFNELTYPVISGIIGDNIRVDQLNSDDIGDIIYRDQYQVITSGGKNDLNNMINESMAWIEQFVHNDVFRESITPVNSSMSNRPKMTLFLLSSLDGKISTGEGNERDVDKDLPGISGVGENLQQYYDIEQTTELWSMNSGFVLAKVGANTKPYQKNDKAVVSFIVIDNKNLNEHGIRSLCARTKNIVLVTTNPNHPATKITDEPNLHIFHITNLEGQILDVLKRLYTEFGCHAITVQTGSTINALLFKKKLIDSIDLIIAPIIVGGVNTPSIVGGESNKTIADLNNLTVLKLKSVSKLKGSYIRARYDVNKNRSILEFVNYVNNHMSKNNSFRDELLLEWDSPTGFVFNNTSIKNQYDLLRWMNNHIDYGWISEEDGKIHGTSDKDDENYFYNYYRLQSPEETMKSGIGVCWDQTEFERSWFTNHNIGHKVYYIEINDGKGCPSHTFILFMSPTHGRIQWFEHSWGIYAGIHTYDSETDAIKDIISKHQDANFDHESPVVVRELADIPKYGCTCQEFMDYAHTQPEINIGNDNNEKIINSFAFERYDSISELPDTLYFASPNKLSGTIKVESDKGLFLTPYKGIASMFCIDRSQIMRHYIRNYLKTNKRINSNYNISYAEWDLPDNQLMQPLSRVHMIHNIPSITSTDEGDSLGYIHEIDISSIKNDLELYVTDDANREVVYKGQCELPILNATEHKVHWSIEYKNTDGIDDGNITVALENDVYDPPLSYDKLPDHLKNDPVHSWRAKTGIELIHKEPTIEELERIWKNWNLMTDDQKRISDEKSIDLFGIDNTTHYWRLVKEYHESNTIITRKGINRANYIPFAEDASSVSNKTDVDEPNKNGVNRKKLYIAFIEWCKEYNQKNTFGNLFDKDVFMVTYPFVPNEMRYFYRLANPILCVLAGELTFFQVSELRKLNSQNPKMDELLIFAATPNDMRVFNNSDKKVYKGTDENGILTIHEVLGDSFDLYIQNMIKKGDILNASDDSITEE